MIAGCPSAYWAAVADHDTIASQRVGQFGKHSFQVDAADFFLAFDQEFDLDRQRVACGKPLADTLNVCEHLAFVIGCAAGIQIAVANGRLESAADPIFQGLGRLHVVVPVYKHDRCSADLRCLCIDHGMPLGFDQANLQSGLLQLVLDPVTCPANLAGFLAVAADAGDSQPIDQVIQMALAVVHQDRTKLFD